jgi:hypothetical protein|tara:strand:+ start:164 stop:445 length:282 start_codon:yes stop_codon:yes gene_type:complete
MPRKVYYYTVRDIVSHYGVSNKTVWRWISDQLIRAKKRNVEGEARRVWCVTIAEFDKVGAIIAHNEARMAPGIRKRNLERSDTFRKGLESGNH